MKKDTSQQFTEIIEQCQQVFVSKQKDYSTSWRIMRLPSITDQIYIKANRIRSIQEKGNQKIEEGITPEFIGIVNYSIMALIQIEKGVANSADLSQEEAAKAFSAHLFAARDLMMDKNHDYDEAWRNMRISSLTDIILMKLLRIKQIENNQGKTTVSEGLDANYQDIINYAVFALIKIVLENES